MAKNRRGRPTKQPKPGKRASLELKLTAQIRQRLDRASQQSGRTQIQEAELRLERSFERQSLFTEVLELQYGRGLAGVLAVLGETMHYALEMLGPFPKPGARLDETLLNDPYAYDEVAKCVEAVLKELRPSGEAKPLSGTVMEMADVQNLPRSVTWPIVAALRGEITGDNPFTDWAERVRPLLFGLGSTTRRSTA